MTKEVQIPAVQTAEVKPLLNLFEDAEFFAGLFGTDIKTIQLREFHSDK